MPVAVLGHFELTAQGCILIDAWDLGVEQQTVDGHPAAQDEIGPGKVAPAAPGAEVALNELAICNVPG